MSALPRLLGYTSRYQGRFVVAFLAMLLYAVASAGVAYLIKPIIDHGLQPNRPDPSLPPDLVFWSVAVLVAYLVKGLGAYLSAYLMTDIGQRVVRAWLDALDRWLAGAGTGHVPHHADRAGLVAWPRRADP